MRVFSTLSCRLFLCISLSICSVQAVGQVAEDTTTPEIESVKLADGVYMLGLYCNILVVDMADGLLIVDSGPNWEVGMLENALARLNKGPVRIVINTHFHYDHVGNNEILAKNGAVIVAHEKARQRMQVEWAFPDAVAIRPVPPYPQTALPALTFTDALTVYAGSNDIKVLHLPNAHSDADVAVFMNKANILHMGDLYLSNGFPPIDSFHGGTVDGEIAALEALANLIDDDTIVVPGHGPLSTRQELREYSSMLSIARDRIISLIKEGKTLEETIAANPTAGLYDRGESWIPPEFFVRMAYEDLDRRYSKSGDVAE